MKHWRICTAGGINTAQY